MIVRGCKIKTPVAMNKLTFRVGIDNLYAYLDDYGLHDDLSELIEINRKKENQKFNYKMREHG